VWWFEDYSEFLICGFGHDAARGSEHVFVANIHGGGGTALGGEGKRESKNWELSGGVSQKIKFCRLRSR
jgi:hypothetical protein